MFSRRHNFKLLTLFLAGSVTTTNADWLLDTGREELIDYLEVTEVPSTFTDNVPLVMVEAEANIDTETDLGDYMPNIANSNFSHKNFINETSTSSGTSNHANTVATRFFSNSASYVLGSGTNNDVSVYSANDFINSVLPSSLTPLPGRVATHAYISNIPSGLSDPASATSREIHAQRMHRYDYYASTGNTLMVAGFNNNSTFPLLWAHSYNGLIVGVSDGTHSVGFTSSVLEDEGVTGGRTKPDIVGSDNFTSFATGQIASAGAYVYGYANSLGHTEITNNTYLQRAILLAGASKKGLTNSSGDSVTWENSSTVPLDTTYGAGLLNVFNSHRIVEAGSPADSTISFHGWDDLSISSTATNLTFTIPSGITDAELSFVMTWDREITAGFFPGSPVTAQALADLSISISGGTLTSPLVSDSALDNVEHVFAKNLGPGTYAVTLNNNGTGSVPAGIAWRTKVNPTLNVTDSTVELSGLSTEMHLEVYESSDLVTWTFIEELAITGDTHSWTRPVATEEREFYRFRHWIGN